MTTERTEELTREPTGAMIAAADDLIPIARGTESYRGFPVPEEIWRVMFDAGTLPGWRCVHCKRVTYSAAEPEECATRFCHGRSFAEVANTRSLTPQAGEGVERVAKALCLSNGDDWNREGPGGLDSYREQARAAIAAIPPSGRVEEAARALIADVRRRYPGEELRCEYMRELDAALGGQP